MSYLGRDIIPFNKPHIAGREAEYILDAVANGKISGNGKYTDKCQKYLISKYQFNRCLLTSSCTDALEMAALLCNIQPGDEIIMPSYTFVSTANAFVLRGAVIKFIDSRSDHPGMDETQIETLISPRTKAIVVVHYAGVACDMDRIMDIATRHNLFVVEDAAQAIDSYYRGKVLGSFGNCAAFSFHETKNIISGEGGMLVVNDKTMEGRAEIIWEKGTNRSAFFRGEVDKYNWVDIGSSFLPSDIIAAFLYAQLENLEAIQLRRREIWNNYNEGLSTIALEGAFRIPTIPDYATNNAHMFYVVCNSAGERNSLIQYLRNKGIHAVFHYLSLHRSPFFSKNHDGRSLTNSDNYSDCLVRLPFYFELYPELQKEVVKEILSWADLSKRQKPS